MNVKDHLKGLSIILAILLLLDLPMILYFNADMYTNTFNDINGLNSLNSLNGLSQDSQDSQGESKLRKFVSALLCYCLMAVGIYYFIIRTELSLYDTLINSALLGLLIYGIYNTTTLFTINQYNIKTALIDTIWGVVLVTVTALISKILIGQFVSGGTEVFDTIEDLVI